MAKGDDALARKKNKSTRKKMNRKNDSATVSARIASIIAAKKRRKSGKRSMCQGMCFSLPTLEDPFNERQSKVDITKKKTKKVKTRDALSNKGSSRSLGDNKTLREEKKRSPMSIDGDEEKRVQMPNGDSPPKFLMLGINKIDTSFHCNGTYSVDYEDFLYTSIWGFEFWKCFSSGKDILETSGTSSTLEQIAWIVSTAADAIATREKQQQNESFSNSPFLLYLVSSQSKASKVRSVCKALKVLGIHAVSLHQGASLDHQISGLKSCEPEFLIATPERLLEIVTLKGIDISGVSMLVIDELGSLCNAGYLDAVKSIKQAISCKHQSIVFNDSFKASYIPAVQSLLGRSISRIALNDSVASQSSCIIQTVNVCTSEENKLEKFLEVVESASSKIIYIITKEESFGKLKTLLKLNGNTVSANSESKITKVKKSRKPMARLIDIEELETTDMNDFESVILPEFVPTTDKYIEILTSMARDSVHGELHSFLTEKEANPVAGKLVSILEDCGQNVPISLRKTNVVSSF